MKEFHKLVVILAFLLFMVTSLLASDWCGSFTVRGGRTDPECDIESPWKTLFMFGASYEMWYKEVLSIGPYVYFSQLHSGPLDESNWDEDPNFRTYIAGLDVKARFRPNWKWSNIWFPDHFISRIAPYVDGGAGIITFDPTRRSSYSAIIPGDYDRHAGVFPVVGGGISLFSRLGVSADIGVEYHAVNSDYLDGHKMNDDKDAFWTGYIGLMLISSCRVPVPGVVIPEEPEPIMEIEPEVAFLPQLFVTPPVQNVPFQAGQTTFDVESNVAWIVSEGEDWLKVTPGSGSNNGTLQVDYDANPNETPRTGVITVSGGGISRTVQVVQGAPRLDVTPNIQEVPYTPGTTTFDVASNVAWTVEEAEDWFTVEPGTGINDGKLNVTYDANPKSVIRIGQLTVSGGGLSRTVSVVQAERKIEFKKDVNLIIEGVNFKTDKADLTEGAKLILDEVVKTLNEFPEVTLEIQGHTDSDASDAYNIDLSRRRSLSVKAYLVDHGIDAGRLTTSWFGERRPIATNSTPAGKAKNRRIEFKRTD